MSKLQSVDEVCEMQASSGYMTSRTDHSSLSSRSDALEMSKLLIFLIVIGMFSMYFLMTYLSESKYEEISMRMDYHSDRMAVFFSSLLALEASMEKKFESTSSEMRVMGSNIQMFEKDFNFMLSQQGKDRESVKGRVEILEKKFRRFQDIDYKNRLEILLVQHQQFLNEMKNVKKSVELIRSAMTSHVKPTESVWPLRLPYVNEFMERIEDRLYPSEESRQRRIEFHRSRVRNVDGRGRNEYQNLHLVKYNQIGDESQEREAVRENKADWERLEKKFAFSKVAKELPMCVVTPGYNNNANYRIEYSLNSIFTQNYTNYKVVIIDDASTDGSPEVYSKYLEFYKIDTSHYTLIRNAKRLTALENIYRAAHDHCSQDSIVVTVDADDELIGRNVLQLINWAYVVKKAGAVYSNFIFWTPSEGKAQRGFTQAYTEDEKRNNRYRDVGAKFSQLRTYRNELLRQIAAKDLQDDKGEFFKITHDVALYLPVMEMSCGRVEHLDEYQYLYNIETGLNDYIQIKFQKEVNAAIRRQKKYECNRLFDERMKS